MQVHILTPKSIKQSVANVKTYLAEKNVKIASSVVCELLAKAFFNKSYNELILSSQSKPQKNFDLSEIFLQFSGQAPTLAQIKELCLHIANKANYALQAIEEYQEIEPGSFKITVNNEIGAKNSLTFLMLIQQTSLQQGWLLVGLTRSSVRGESENLLIPNEASTQPIASLTKQNRFNFADRLAQDLISKLKSQFNSSYTGPVSQITFGNHLEDGSFEFWGQNPAQEVFCLFFNMLTKEVASAKYLADLNQHGSFFDKKDLVFLTRLKAELDNSLEDGFEIAIKKAIFKKCAENSLGNKNSEIYLIWSKEQGWLI